MLLTERGGADSIFILSYMYGDAENRKKSRRNIKTFKMKLLFLLLSFVFFSSFSSPLPVKSGKTSPNGFQDSHLKQILFGYSFTYQGCNVDVTILVETTTGNGVGMMTATCGHGKPRSIYFDVHGANFTRISASDLSDFRTDEGSYIASSDEIQNIVDGYNSNVPIE